MRKYGYGILMVLIAFVLLALIFFAFIKSADFENRLNQSEVVANKLKEEVIRLQEVAINAEASAKTAEMETLRCTNEANQLLEELAKCKSK
ncbi:hypothetical protein [Ekhidna sp.]